MAIARKRKLRVNFIALHYYQDFTNANAIASLRTSLIQIHDTFHLPVWVTEIGTMNIQAWGHAMSRSPSEAMAVSYTRQALALLNSLPFVKRYAWFTDVCQNDTACGFDSLFGDSGTPTSIGDVFARAAESAPAGSTRRHSPTKSRPFHSAAKQSLRPRLAGGFS